MSDSHEGYWTVFQELNLEKININSLLENSVLVAAVFAFKVHEMIILQLLFSYGRIVLINGRSIFEIPELSLEMWIIWLYKTTGIISTHLHKFCLLQE